MSRETVRLGLGALLGFGYITLGIVESAFGLATGEGGVLFWLPALWAEVS